MGQTGTFITPEGAGHTFLSAPLTYVKHIVHSTLLLPLCYYYHNPQQGPLLRCNFLKRQYPLAIYFFVCLSHRCAYSLRAET